LTAADREGSGGTGDPSLIHGLNTGDQSAIVIITMRLLFSALVTFALLGVAVGCTSGGRTTSIDYYWADAEDNLVIQVTTGDLTVTQVANVTETADAVTVTVRSVSAPVPMADIGYALNLTVELRGPLAGRHVLDGSIGQPAPRCRDIVACVDRGTRDS
jgi:hypothetical protein